MTNEVSPQRGQLLFWWRDARRLRKTLLVGAGALLALLILAYVFRAPLLRIPARFLVIDHEPRRAEVVVVLNGGEGERALRAAELYRRGVASRIAIARAEATVAVELGLVPNITDIAVDILKAAGVPPDSIIVVAFDSAVTSTRDEAVAVSRYLEANDIASLILVTTGFHTRRARWIFRKALSPAVDLQVVAAPHNGFDQNNWWKHEDGFVYLYSEFAKLFYYVIRY